MTHPVLPLPAEMTIYTAARTRDAWLGALAHAADGPLRLPAGDVTEIDAAGLQLLVSLRHTLALQQRTLQLIEPSDVLRAACARAGLREIAP